MHTVKAVVVFRRKGAKRDRCNRICPQSNARVTHRANPIVGRLEKPVRRTSRRRLGRVATHTSAGLNLRAHPRLLFDIVRILHAWIQLTDAVGRLRGIIGPLRSHDVARCVVREVAPFFGAARNGLPGTHLAAFRGSSRLAGQRLHAHPGGLDKDVATAGAPTTAGRCRHPRALPKGLAPGFLEVTTVGIAIRGHNVCAAVFGSEFALALKGFRGAGRSALSSNIAAIRSDLLLAPTIAIRSALGLAREGALVVAHRSGLCASRIGLAGGRVGRRRIASGARKYSSYEE